MELTNFEKLLEYSRGIEVELPPFAEGMPLIAKVRRPSLLSLASAGKIPNPLLESVQEMFLAAKEQKQEVKGQALIDLYELSKIIAEASLIAPSYEDIKSAGLELTDEQLMFLLNFAQNGNNKLKSFRTE